MCGESCTAREYGQEHGEEDFHRGAFLASGEWITILVRAIRAESYNVHEFSPGAKVIERMSPLLPAKVSRQKDARQATTDQNDRAVPNAGMSNARIGTGQRHGHRADRARGEPDQP